MQAMGKLHGNVAIVTGAGRGMGRAIAEAFLQQGAKVTATAACEQHELAYLERLWPSEQIFTLLADVTDPTACERVVAETLRRFGQVDVLINNAGRGMKYVRSTFMAQPTHFWEVAPETWHMIIETNVNGPFYMTRAVVPHMLQRGRGSIINISMNYETMKRRGFSPYGPSKAALESASAIWAQDLADTGIRVNILLPGGATNTGMIPSGVPDEARARLLQPTIMADPAVFLASDASRALTGRRLVATEWNPEQPDGRPITDGIGC
jgi:NAD(P)-dependent dehydrogenase (short-subunit alcohol dehydrogenase family)